MSDIIRELLQKQDTTINHFKSKVILESAAYKPNEKIIIKGTKYDYFCYINSGRVRIVLKADAGGSTYQPKIGSIVAELCEHDIFGEFAMFDNQPAGADIIAITDTIITKIDRNSFVQFMENNPAIGYRIMTDMMQAMIKRIRNENKLFYHILINAIEAQKQIPN